MRAISRLFTLLVLVAALPAAGGESAEKVLQALQLERSEAGARNLVRRADLDRVAKARAERIAEITKSTGSSSTRSF